MLDFAFSTSDEITAELGLRLKAVRLSQSLTQADLAERAGVSVGTVKVLEKTGQTSVASLIRVVQALGLTDQLQSLFVLKVQSIAEMEQAQLAQRQRHRARPGFPCGVGHEEAAGVLRRLGRALANGHPGR